MDVINTPRYEDFELSYHDKNPWAHLGIGYSVNNHNGNFSPYLAENFIDPKWQKAIGGPAPVSQENSRGNGLSNGHNNGHKDEALEEAAIMPENPQLKGPS